MRLNVIGSWIYFNRIGYNGIWRMRVNGSRLQQISPNNGTIVIVVDGWVYYSHNIGMLGLENMELARMRTDGSERTIINHAPISNFEVWDDWVFYSVDDLHGGGLYKVRTDGSELTRISEMNMRSRFVIYDEWLFYRNANDGRPFQIYRMRLDGTGTELIVHYNAISPFNILGGWIYYQTMQNDNRIYRIRIDGTNHELFHIADSESLAAIVTTDGWIYYSTLPFPSIPNYRIRTDGTNHQRLNY